MPQYDPTDEGEATMARLAIAFAEAQERGDQEDMERISAHLRAIQERIGKETDR